MGFVSVVILAAGESKRMGQPKLLMPWQGKTIIENTLDNYLASKTSEIVVVLGYKADELSAVIGDRPVIRVVNRNFRQGMSSSLICGIRCVSQKSDGIMLALADQPNINTKTIDKVIESFNNYRGCIVVPVYQGRRGHPVIFDIRYKDELLNIKGDIGAREVVFRHSDKIREAAVNSEDVLIDIDTPADFQKHFNGDMGG